MIPLQTIIDQMTGPSILTELTELLRQCNPEFPKAENDYYAAVSRLRQSLGPSRQPKLEEYLTNYESVIIARIVYAGHLGYRANLENFRDPGGNNFLQYDFSVILKEHIMDSFPPSLANVDWETPFYQSLSGAQKELLEVIDKYYSHLYVPGPKLAHYAGYMIANKLLPWTEPGYIPDVVQTDFYYIKLKRYCGYTPFSEDMF